MEKNSSMPETFVVNLEKVMSNGNVVENNMIEYIDVNLVGHFNNLPQLQIVTIDGWCIMSGYNNLYNLGFILRAIVNLLEISEEDGLSISKIRNIPIRVILAHENGPCIGFGHFKKDKFVFISDLLKLES